MRAALARAEAEVVAAENRARAKLRQSQARAVRQHISALTRAAKRYEEGTAQCVAAWHDMVAAGAAITRLLPSDDRTFEGCALAVSPRRLQQCCHAELARVGALHPLEKGNPPPGANWYGHPDVPHGSSVKQLPPLADRLKDRLLRDWRHLCGSSPAPVTEPKPHRKQPAPVSSTAEPDPTPAVSEASPISSTAAVGKPSVAEPVMIDPDKAHPYDIEARAGFAAELAIVRGEVELHPVAELTEGLETIVDLADPAVVEIASTETAVQVVDIQAEPVNPPGAVLNLDRSRASWSAS
jgi:hypothetical protein